MKKMISASIALLVMEEPHGGPTVVMLILSSGVVWFEPLVGVMFAVVDAAVVAVVPALAADVVVVGLAVVEVVVVGVDFGAWAAVTSSSAFWTLLLMVCCCVSESLLRSDWTFSVCLLPLPSSWTVGSIRPVPFNASVAWVCVTPGAEM